MTKRKGRAGTASRPKDRDATPRCKRCGRKIVWGSDGFGKRIPLDPTPAVYKMWGIKDGVTFVERERNAMVVHFATCTGKRDRKSEV